MDHVHISAWRVARHWDTDKRDCFIGLGVEIMQRLFGTGPYLGRGYLRVLTNTEPRFSEAKNSGTVYIIIIFNREKNPRGSKITEANYNICLVVNHTLAGRHQ